MVAAGSLVALGCTASAGAAPDAPCAGADRRPAAKTESAARTAVLCLLDAARAGRGLPPLRAEVHAGRAAQRFAEALDPHKPLTHVGRGGSILQDRLAQAGYAGGARRAFDAGEALGRSIGRSATPAQRVSAWLADGPTRRILLSARFRDAGLGVSVTGDRTTYVVDLAAPHRAS